MRRKRASTSSEVLLKTSTPVDGSHVLPTRFFGPTIVLSAGDIGPNVDESAVSVEGARVTTMGGTLCVLMTGEPVAWLIGFAVAAGVDGTGVPGGGVREGDSYEYVS